MPVIIAPRVIPAGTFGPSPAQSIASAPQDRLLLVQFTSNDWLTGEAGLHVTVNIEHSTDGGQSWLPAVGGTFVGGAVSGRTGQLPALGYTLDKNTAIQLRATLTLNQQANSLGFSYSIA